MPHMDVRGVFVPADGCVELITGKFKTTLPAIQHFLWKGATLPAQSRIARKRNELTKQTMGLFEINSEKKL